MVQLVSCSSMTSLGTVMVDEYKGYVFAKFEEYAKANNELTARVAKLEIENKLTRNELQVFKKKCSLYKKERDCYKGLIESYEAEVNGEEYFGLSKESFTKLDGNLVEYQGLIESLEKKLAQLNDKLSEVRRDRDSLKEENDLLKATIEKFREEEKKWQKREERWGQEWNQLKIKYQAIEAREPSDWTKYRIMHLTDNPVDSTIKSNWDEYQFFKKENARLTTRLNIMQTGNPADLTRMVEEDVNNAIEIDKLKQQLQCSEKKRFQLLDGFKKTNKEFREFIISLTGYRIEKCKDTDAYKVSFIYADSPRDYLLFTSEKKGMISLVDTEYSRTFASFIDNYLKLHDSYPAFLAAVSLELFAKYINSKSSC